MENFFKRNLPLIIILVFYLGLSFCNFFQQGLVNWDESYFMVVAHTFSQTIRTLFTHPSKLFSAGYYAGLAANYGNVYTIGKPAYIVSASFIDAIWPSEYSTRFISLLAGCLIIIFFYKILGFYQLKERVKTAATALLALSPMFLIYCRVGLSQILSACFLLMGFFYLLRFKESPEKKELKWLALFTALLLLSHYNTIPLVLILTGYALFVIYQKRLQVKSYLYYFFFLLALPLFWELITQIGARLGRQLGFPADRIFSYSEEILNQFRIAGAFSAGKVGGGILVIERPWYYLKLLLASETFIIAILCLLGAIFALRHIRRLKCQFVLVVVLAALLIFSLSVQLKFPRNIVAVIPLLYLLAAFSLAKIDKFVSLRNNRQALVVLSFIPIFIVALNFYHYIDIFNIKTNFHQIAHWIKSNYQPDEVRIYSSTAPIWRLYLPGYQSEVLKANPPRDSLYAEGRQIIVIDDYYTKIGGEQIYFEGYPKELVKQYQTNIFKVKTIVLDAVFQGGEAVEAMFSQNTPESAINVYQLKSPL